MTYLIDELVWNSYSWDRPMELGDAYDMLSHLASLSPRGYIVFEARGSAGKVTYNFGAERDYFPFVRELFRAHKMSEFLKVPSRTPVTVGSTLTLSNSQLSLNADATVSAIMNALAVLSRTGSDSEAVVQLLLGRGYSPRPASGKITDPHASFLSVALFGGKEASPDSKRKIIDKLDQFSFVASIRIGASGKGAEGKTQKLVSAFKVLEAAGVSITAEPDSPGTINDVFVPWSFTTKLSVKEIAPFLLLPVGEEELPGVPGLHPKRLLPPSWYKEPGKPFYDRSFAVSANSTPKKLSISPADSLEHTIILGPTGSGKSTVMENLILSDIRAGRSVLVLDPKADLVTEILERIPEERRDDVVVIDPSDPCPVGFNPLRFKGFRKKDLVADAVLSVMKEIFADSWGIRTQQILSAALLTLIDVPDATLLWLPELLTNKDFRAEILKHCKDRIGLLPFWQQYEAMKESERNTNIAPVLNKMQQFVFREGLRSVLGQSKPKFDLMDLFTQRKIVLVPLNRGIIGGESARLLGSLIVGLTWTLALSRANLPPEKRHLVSVYIDELQDYLSLPTDLADALAQARGLGVGMTLAHQYRGQLPPEIRAAVDANARNKIIFGLNGTDAKEMVHQAPELKPDDFMLLPRYSVYTNIMQHKRQTGWMQGVTLPPTEPIRKAAEVKNESMRRYGVPAADVDKEFLAMLDSVHAPAEADIPDAGSPIGRKERD